MWFAMVIGVTALVLLELENVKLSLWLIEMSWISEYVTTIQTYSSVDINAMVSADNTACKLCRLTRTALNSSQGFCLWYLAENVWGHGRSTTWQGLSDDKNKHSQDCYGRYTKGIVDESCQGGSGWWPKDVNFHPLLLLLWCMVSVPKFLGLTDSLVCWITGKWGQRGVNESTTCRVRCMWACSALIYQTTGK